MEKQIEIKSTGQILDYSILEQHSKIFIETGAAAGAGIQRAVDAGFKTIVSIEASKEWFDKCVHRFYDEPSVTMYLGKSTDILGSVIDRISNYQSSPFVIYLDAHPSGPASAGHKEVLEGDTSWTQDSIIKAELDIILVKDTVHVIVIDDVNGLTDGHALEYAQKIADKWEDYEFFFYDEWLGDRSTKEHFYPDKILVAIPK